jgi:hypothetical protein
MRNIGAAVLLLISTPVFADDANFSTHLFAKFQVKACTQCHDFYEAKPEALSLTSHKGRSVETCVACHRTSVTSIEHPEEWFAMPGLYTSGMNAKETCEAIMNANNAKFKSKALNKRDMKKHLFEDPRVLWGIEGATPGSGQLPSGKKETDLVKGGFTLWKEQVTAWIDGGLKCQ